jgi:hypothetical protein
MRLFRRKSQRRRLPATVADWLKAIPSKLSLPGRPTDKTVKAGLIAAGGLTGLTAGSAGISSLRHRSEEAGRGEGSGRADRGA